MGRPLIWRAASDGIWPTRWGGRSRPYDDSLNDFDIDYLEAELFRLAVAAKISTPDNQNGGNRRKVDEFRQNELDQYLDEAVILLDLIGVRVFGNQTEKKKSAPAPSILPEPAAVFSEAVPEKPPLPDASLGPCEFVKRAFVNLLESGYSPQNSRS